MTFWLSNPIESLQKNLPDVDAAHVDYLIVGSGYGAAMAALAIAEASSFADVKPSIWIFEKGDEYVPDDFPKTLEHLPRYLNFVSKRSPRAAMPRNDGGLFEVRQGEGISTLSGSGLGGTSLINANVAAEPDPEVLGKWDSRIGSDWKQELPQLYSKIRELLGAKPFPGYEYPKYMALKQTVDGLASSDSVLCGDYSVDPADLTINIADNSTGSAYAHAVKHGACNNCGNCFIGCHSGAKGSLNMNAWPLAKQLGVNLYTGGNVRELHRVSNKSFDWSVICNPIRKSGEIFSVNAKNVILAAGTLGSVEILQRSANREGGLSVSPQLGRRFSANGDTLVTSLGQKNAVHGIAGKPDTSINSECRAEAPGPTIVGKGSIMLDLDNGGGSSNRITLEDSAIPYPLVPLWQEILTTQSFIYRFEDSKLSHWHQRHSEHDYLAVSSDLNHHSQMLLIMGDDHAEGRLEYHQSDSAEGVSWALPSWPQSKDPEGSTPNYYDLLHRKFSYHQINNSHSVFNGGQYHPNPLWKPLPDRFAREVAGGNELNGGLLSVHPLGGCCVGKNSDEGVVNLKAQVFVGGHDKEAVYSSLFVLDGSIIPGAIGTNPFLTIASLSYLLAHNIVSSAPPPTSGFPALKRLERYKDWHKIPAGSNKHSIPTDVENTVNGVFSERFFYHIDRERKVGMPWSAMIGPSVNEIEELFGDSMQWGGSPLTLVLDTKFFMDNVDIDSENSLEKWIQRPDTPLRAEATLKYDVSGSVLKIPTAHLMDIVELEGTITLAKRIPADSVFENMLRRWSAYRRYRKTQRYGPGIIALGLSRLKKGEFWSSLGGLWRTAGLHANWREMKYDFNSKESGIGDNLNITLKGKKVIAYGVGKKDIFASLMTLPVRMYSADTKREVKILLEMDSVRTTEGPSPLQIFDHKNLIHSLTQIVGIAAFYTRVILQSHFWSFGALDYEKFQSKGEMDAIRKEGESPNKSSRLFPPSNRIDYRAPQADSSGDVKQSTEKEEYHWDSKGEAWLSRKDWIESNAVDCGKDNICRLIRYQPEELGNQETRKSLLLIHGLAHSSRVFWADTIDENFVQYFLRKNYDVWILDHRTSPNYVEAVNPKHTWDDIALEDIPNSVDFIFDRINIGNTGMRKKLHVFSHCIGAGAASIALLTGRLNVGGVPGGQSESKLASFVPHAATPWLFASVENRARENIWALFKELDLFNIIDPFPHKNTSFREMIVDRVATATLNTNEDAQWKVKECKEDSVTGKIRISLWKSFWIRKQDKKDERGPGFSRAIYTRYTTIWGRQWYKGNVNWATRKYFSSMIGATPRDVMQQVYFSVTRGMLSNHHGNNVYVNHKNITDNWKIPTLFLHGDKNTVFDIESSRKSAYMLTRHRMQALGSGKSPEPTSEDYCNNNVWLENLSDYGHMDVIFGKNAHKDVYPKLDEFFEAAEQIAQGNAMPNYFQSRISSHSSKLSEVGFQAACKPDSHFKPIKRPLTGPIISRPQIVTENNAKTKKEVKVRIWCEVQDFNSMPAEVIGIQEGKKFSFGRNSQQARTWLKKDILDCSRSHPSSSGSQIKGVAVENEFWLREYIFNPEIDKPRYLWIASGERNKKKRKRPKTNIQLHWNRLDWLRRLVASDEDSPAETSLSFLLGSCFYPGTTFDNEQSYNVYNGMYAHVDPQGETPYRGVDHILLLGDQIYADSTANVFDPKTGYERYRSRYRQAWGYKVYPDVSPTQRLFSNVPTYFAIDDHEFDNNYQGNLVDKNMRERFEYASNMAWLFQMHQYNWNLSDRMLYQDFTSAGYKFFLFDTRMERQSKEEGFSRNHVESLISRNQLSKFKEWLVSVAGTEKPIFIGSGSSLAPFSNSITEVESDLLRGGDTLASYPGFLSAIVDILSEYARHTHVCWMTGDPHLSCYAKLSISNGKNEVNLLNICSSGLYVPLSFMNTLPDSCSWGRRFSINVPDSTVTISSSGQELISDNHQHFVRADLFDHNSGAPSIQLGAFDANGKALSEMISIELDKVHSN
ncbi:MAG: hypothetical protein DHS20C09_05540 [marine bacterium B5-7]|nr:MAG: hypothetical protein DHS20C09_05540 [marine bacterium B5-7]